MCLFQEPTLVRVWSRVMWVVVAAAVGLAKGPKTGVLPLVVLLVVRLLPHHQWVLVTVAARIKQTRAETRSVLLSCHH